MLLWGRAGEALPGEPWGGGLELRLQEHPDADLPPAAAGRGDASAAPSVHLPSMRARAHTSAVAA